MRRSIVVSCAGAIGVLGILSAQDFARGSLMWYINRAKANHQTVVHLPIPKELYAEVGDLSSAAGRASVVLVNFVDEVTTYDTYEIHTWTKFRIRERLGRYQRIREDDLSSDVPERLLPILPNEFITVQPLGTVQLGGVTLIRMDSRLTPLPASEPRLMFVQFSAGGSMAGLTFGHEGVFSITFDGYLRPRLDTSHNELKQQIDSCCGGRLDKLRGLLR